MGAAAGATRQFRRHLAPFVAAVLALGPALRGVLLARPEDEPDRPDHGDLQHHDEKENRPESAHATEFRKFAGSRRIGAPVPSGVAFRRLGLGDQPASPGDQRFGFRLLQTLCRIGGDEFVIALGYKGEYIKRYFVDYLSLNGSMSIDMANV